MFAFAVFAAVWDGERGRGEGDGLESAEGDKG